MGFECSLLQDSRAVRFFDRKVSSEFVTFVRSQLSNVHDSSISVLKSLLLSLIYGKILNVFCRTIIQLMAKTRFSLQRLIIIQPLLYASLGVDQMLFQA